MPITITKDADTRTFATAGEMNAENIKSGTLVEDKDGDVYLFVTSLNREQSDLIRLNLDTHGALLKAGYNSPLRISDASVTISNR